MGADRLLSLVLGLALAECSTPMTLREIQEGCPIVRASTSIAMLEKEKAENDQRLLAGIQSVAPALAALNLVAGTYGRNVAIAAGDWAAAIDRKLVGSNLNRTAMVA